MQDSTVFEHFVPFRMKIRLAERDRQELFREKGAKRMEIYAVYSEFLMIL